MTDELLAVRAFSRAVAFEDVTVRSDGDGRTVEAYAAAFNIPAEVRDADGHYNEEMSRTSFDKTIQDNGTNFGVFYNHARTLAGTPDGALSVPIGVPLEVRSDDRGVFTATRYLDNPLADSVLNAIKERAIRGQSFSGRFIKSTRARAQRGGLPTIYRNEVAMREYGPTVFPVHASASILATRSVSDFLDELSQLDPEDMDRFRHMLGITAPAAGALVTPSGADPAEEPQLALRSVTQFAFAAQVQQRGILR